MNLNFPPTAVFTLLGYNSICRYNLTFLSKLATFHELSVSPNVCVFWECRLGSVSNRNEAFVMGLRQEIPERGNFEMSRSKTGTSDSFSFKQKNI